MVIRKKIRTFLTVMEDSKRKWLSEEKKSGLFLTVMEDRKGRLQSGKKLGLFFYSNSGRQ